MARFRFPWAERQVLQAEVPVSTLFRIRAWEERKAEMMQLAVGNISRERIMMLRLTELQSSES